MNRKNQENRNEILPIYEEGESTTLIKSVRSLGIDPATGQELFQKLNGEKTFVWDAADKVPVGDTEPKVRGAVCQFGFLLSVRGRPLQPDPGR